MAGTERGREGQSEDKENLQERDKRHPQNQKNDADQFEIFTRSAPNDVTRNSSLKQSQRKPKTKEEVTEKFPEQN